MIIRCPYCYLKGEKKNLAEIQEDGGIKVIRVNGTVDFTVIYAKEFSLICGACLNTVIYKETTIIPTPQVDVLAVWGTIMNYYGTI